MRRIYRGEMYFADLNPVIGSEQGGVRPALIIQNNVGNQHSPTVIVAAISSKAGEKTYLPTHCVLTKAHGLHGHSLVLLEQIRTIDKSRLKNYVGRVGREDMCRIDRCLRVSLGLGRDGKGH